MSTSIVFDHLFTVDSIDKDGKKFDRVARVGAISTTPNLNCIIDLPIEIFSLSQNEKFTLALSTSLSSDNGTSGWRPGMGNEGLAADYEYVCFGKVYKFDEGKQEIATAYISFGGLLLAITGHVRYLTDISVGEDIYLLIRR
ncbi:RNA polymerase [Wallemia mellicola CBS 633.66]|uniref:DNA-directed RNA polymerases I, II, and III subunit RPABC3 n=1 Tax=Wallemia mellicola (strain ATCC MYA-4683 / CBS 633.66) TaxID=671144 RepID=I4Y7T8_WALMC|nr:RNA polymerase [Wallemia mellicola CBS 633.66]EIM20030.1 RNA polymerase [Wallemia mellicola CBS 633.66]TIC14142.1 RNA polymerase [Wallemia mellicola]|eukprot:XP_006959959.1 RNA polymerase [Wallemia mellicola CBS 633.66]